MGRYLRIKRYIKRILGRQEEKGIILMYHRIANIATSPYHGIVSVDHFAEQMEYLHKKYRPLRLTRIADAVRKGAIPRNGVVITFDDGFADNLYNALPILERYGIPATIFITSGYIGRKREFWWDELERIFFLPERLPEFLPIGFGNRLLNVSMPQTDKAKRITLIRAIQQLLKNLSTPDRDAMLQALFDWGGIDENGRENYLAMNAEELRKIADHELIDIGAHTITHPALSSLSKEDQRKEISESVQAVSEVIGRPVTTFAYPFGDIQDVNEDSFAIVRSLEMRAAVTTIPDSVRKNADTVKLPRVWVGDWDRETFANTIAPYFF